ncbi:MAG: MFS transporter [Clostridia bacterium]|nr:MFS transporter [Clostridia bacterium]
MRRRFRESSIYRLFNLQNEQAQGRCVMLASSVLTNVISWLTGSLFYTSFLMANGIDLVKIGVISFVPYIANLFSVFSPSILERFPRRRWVLFGGRLAYYTLNILAITVMPMLVQDQNGRTACFVVLVFAANIVNALFSSGYSAWHLNFIPNNIRAEYFSTSSMIASFIGIGTGLISSLIADAFAASPHAYTIIITLRFAAYALALVELWALARPVEYPYEKTVDKVRLSDIVTKPFAHPKFILTIVIIMAWTFFVNTSASSINYYLLNNVGTTYTYVYFLNMLYPAVMLFLIKPAQRIINRYGWFRTYAVSALLYALPCFLYSFVTARNYLWMLAIVRMSQHVTGVALNTASSNLPFVNMPDTDRTNYLAFHTIATNAAAFLGMLSGTLFIKFWPDLLITIAGFTFCNIQVLMWIESFGRVLVGLMVLKLRAHVEPDPS